MVTRWGVILVAALVAVSPAMAQQQPGDEKTETEVREFNLWLDDETDKSTDETDDSNGRPLLKIDIEGLPGTDTDESDIDKPDVEDPGVERSGTISDEESELVAQLRREVRAMRREMNRLRARVDEMAARMAEAEAQVPGEPVVEPEVHAEAEKESFHPFWLPQP